MAAKHIRQTTIRVEQVLKTSNDARDSDMVLWLAICANHYQLIELIGREAYVKLRRFVTQFDVPTPETVGRIRRKFQEAGNYKGSKYMAKQAEEIKVQKELGYNV